MPLAGAEMVAPRGVQVGLGGHVGVQIRLNVASNRMLNKITIFEPFTGRFRPPPGPQTCLERKRKADSEKAVVATLRLLLSCGFLLAPRWFKLFSGSCLVQHRRKLGPKGFP